MIVSTVNITSDQQIFWQYGVVKLNETIVTTWAMMIVMTLGSMLITRKLATERTISRWQSALEIIVTGIEGQIREVGLGEPRKYLSFLGTLSFSLGRAAYASSFPDSSRQPVRSRQTAALALCVFIAVPLFGIRSRVSLVISARTSSRP